VPARVLSPMVVVERRRSAGAGAPVGGVETVAGVAATAVAAARVVADVMTPGVVLLALVHVSTRNDDQTTFTSTSTPRSPRITRTAYRLS